MSTRLVSLAAGTVPDADPATLVDAAAAAGFDGCGVWFDPETWNDRVAREVRARFDATGLVPLDIEPIILTPEGDPGERLVDAAVAIGARFVLLASRWPDRDAAIERTAMLCRRVAGTGVTIAVEFLPPFAVNTLVSAVSFAADVDQPNCAVLIDTLHLDRSGGSVADVLGCDRSLFPYVQLADAPAAPGADWREEAMWGRLLPGDGALPLVEFLRAVPDVPISVELRSRQLAVDHPDFTDRARSVLAATRRVLSR